MESLANVYLAFLNHMQKPDGNFHNYLAYERTFLDVDGSEDCKGRTLWACGSVINSNLSNDLRSVAQDIFDRGLPWVWKSTSLRFFSFALLGLYEYYQATPNQKLQEDTEKIGDSLVKYYENEVGDGWRWFEPHLTYDNARLPQSLFAAYMVTKKSQFLQVAEESMDFLFKTQLANNIYMPIGNDGWYKRGEKRALYDQQPLEASAMVEACVDAYYATRKKRYLNLAETVFGWFLGKNSRGLMLYNPQTGGCCDGLSNGGVNCNQGGESSISYLLARLKLEELTQVMGGPKLSSLKSHGRIFFKR